jgi:ABC-type molybdate transport system substrate-binding protein
MTVLAAASLTDSFQAKAGAPADVFASADDAIMKKTTDTGAAQDARPFTSRPT